MTSLAPGRLAVRLACALAALATLVLVPLSLQAAGASRDLARERARITRTVAQVERVQELRRELSTGHGNESSTPEAPLATRVSGVLAAAGLPQSTLAGLSPESLSQHSDAGAALRRRATLSLQGLTLPELGRLIAAWHEQEPLWSITSIETSPLTSGKPTPGADLPLRAVLVVETLSFTDGTRP